MLANNPGFELMGIAADMLTALKLAQDSHPDVIIYDGVAGEDYGAELAQLFELSPERLVTLSLEETNMTIFSRQQIEQATVDDLLQSIQQKDE